MLCRLGTIGAGIGVLSVCLALTSLSWQYVLLGFALASIVWTIWSCGTQIRQHQDNARQDKRPVSIENRRRRAMQNLVGFAPQSFNSNAQNM
jgi:hypothetical protein